MKLLLLLHSITSHSTTLHSTTKARLYSKCSLHIIKLFSHEWFMCIKSCRYNIFIILRYLDFEWEFNHNNYLNTVKRTMSDYNSWFLRTPRLLPKCPRCHSLRLDHELFSISRVLHHQQMCLTCWLLDSNSDCWTRWLPIISNGCRCNWSLRCTSLDTFTNLWHHFVRVRIENTRSKTIPQWVSCSSCFIVSCRYIVSLHK